MRSKNQLTIRKQILIVNMTISAVLLIAFMAFSCYLNHKGQKDIEAYNLKTLNMIDSDFRMESFRMKQFSNTCLNDSTFVLSAVNQLGAARLVADAKEIGEKLRLICDSSPCMEDAFLYVKNTDQIISKSGYHYDRKLYLRNIRKYFSDGDSMGVIEHLENLKEGFYRCDNSVVYISNLLNQGSVVMILNTDELLGLKKIHMLLPNYEVLIFDPDQQIFLSGSTQAEQLYEELNARHPIRTDESGSWNQGKYRITQKIGENGFRYVAMGNKNSLQKQQLWFNFMIIAAYAVIIVICLGMILLNSRIYKPLRKISSRIGENGAQNEFEIINRGFDTLLMENMRINQCMKEHTENNLNMMVNYAIRSQNALSDELADDIRHYFDQYLIVSIAAQGDQGQILFDMNSIDDYFSDTVDGYPVHLDGYTRSYMIPYDTQANSPSSKIIAENLKQYLKDSGIQDMIFVGISSSCCDVRKMHQIFDQAQRRMMSCRMENGKQVLICTSDEECVENSIIPLEVQSTIVHDMEKKHWNEVKKILDGIFQQTEEMTLNGHIAVFQSLKILLHMVASSMGISEEVQNDLITLKSPVVYNPIYMQNIIEKDFMTINQCSCNAKESFRYQIPEYVQEHFREPLSLNMIADAFNITPVYLSTWFKKNIGINLQTYITNIRINEAKHLLIEKPELTAIEVAEAVGFFSKPTFFRQFKNVTGMTPDQYRKTNFVQQIK